MAYDNTNSGSLFTNNKKQTDKHPDYTGTIDVEGTVYWLSAWKKRSKAGIDYLSLSVKKQDAKPITPHSEAKGNAYVRDDSTPAAIDDEIPF